MNHREGRKVAQTGDFGVVADSRPEATGEHTRQSGDYVAAIDTRTEPRGRRGRPYVQLEGAKGAEVVYRPDRYSPDDFGLVQVTLTLTGLNGEDVACAVENISQTGMAFVRPAELICRPGEVLSTIQLSFDNYTAYRGRALVRTVRSLNGERLVGVEFLDYLLNIDDVLRLRDVKAAHRNSADALSSALSSWRVAGHHEFKAQVAEFGLFLRSAKEQFGRLEASLPWEDIHGPEETPAKRQLMEEIDEGFSRTHCSWLEDINRIYVHMEAPEAEALKAYSRALLHPIYLEAPVTRRMYEKPLGYAGDYMVMNYLYKQRFEGSTLFAKAVHRATSNEAGAAAVRYRKDLMKAQLRRRIEEAPKDRPLRVVSLASGPAQELFELLPTLSADSPPLELLLFDQDRKALQYAMTRLLSVVREHRLDFVRLTPLNDTIKSLILGESVLQGKSGVDFCYSAGLMDYLGQALGRRLVSEFYGLLAPGGECWVGNFGPSNPSRWTCEHLTEWYLRYRSPEQMRDLAAELPESAGRRMVVDDRAIHPFLVLSRDE